MDDLIAFTITNRSVGRPPKLCDSKLLIYKNFYYEINIKVGPKVKVVL